MISRDRGEIVARSREITRDQGPGQAAQGRGVISPRSRRDLAAISRGGNPRALPSAPEEGVWDGRRVRLWFLVGGDGGWRGGGKGYLSARLARPDTGQHMHMRDTHPAPGVFCSRPLAHGITSNIPPVPSRYGPAQGTGGVLIVEHIAHATGSARGRGAACLRRPGDALIRR